MIRLQYKIIILLYNLLFVMLLPVLFLRLMLKSIKLKSYRKRLLERIGIFKIANYYKNNDLKIWIHAVSVGEIISCLPILKNLKEKLPQAKIILTCTTPLGSETIKKRLADSVFHVYVPFDINFAIKNFLKKTKPHLLIIIEKELWPNIILNCYKNNIPVIVANAQISNKSFYKYLWIKPLISHCLKKINFICTQTKFDSYKLNKLINYDLKMTSQNNIILVGNTKFDITTIKKNKITDNLPQIPIWIAASTHEGEEKLILTAHKLILKKIPKAVLVLVPRHIERCNQIIKLLNNFNFSYKIHSKNFNNKKLDEQDDLNYLIKSLDKTQIYLIDTIGDLNKLYTISWAAFVGGSLVPVGGHNILEPASLGIPITIGPYTDNYKELVFRIKLTNGLITITNTYELSLTIINWLTDHNLRKKIGNNANNYLINQTGASEKITKLAIKLIASS